MTCMVLDSPVLELNKSWMPLNIIDARRAFSMMMAGLARAVEPETYQLHTFDTWADLLAMDDEPVIHTVSLALKIPEIIVLNKYDAMPMKKTIFSRRNVYKRDKNTCQYCGSQPGTEEITIDHVIPKSKGGQSSWTNCVCACVPCNAKKAAKTLVQAKMRLKHLPIEPKWTPGMAIARFNMKSSWSKFISDAYWNVELQG